MSSFEAAMEFVLRWEGGLSMDPEDPGNWTGGAKGHGELRGTKFGISAATYPDVDIAGLTERAVTDIYVRDYWVPSGASQKNWPMDLMVFDAAVQHGVQRAVRWSRTYETPWAFYAKRMRFYTSLEEMFPRYGRGWMNRMADLAQTVQSRDYPMTVQAVVVNRPLAKRIYDAFDPVIRRRQLVRIRPLTSGPGLKVDISDG